MAKGRQIYLQSEEIETLARLVENEQMQVGDNKALAEEYRDNSSTSKNDWQADVDEAEQQLAALRGLLKKLWYYK